MKWILFTLFFIAFDGLTQPCRYFKKIFPAYTKTTNVVYSMAPGIPSIYLSEVFTTNQQLQMDIYQPYGDTAQKRALILFAHPGGFVSGSRLSDDMVSLCDSFAVRGFVTATMDYRMNFNVLSSNSAERAVYRATQDASAAVRYFKQNAVTYRIDTNKIFFWGSSAGAFMAIHLAYLDDAERPASTFAGALQPDLGCINCTGTPLNSSSKIAGVISCWGAISDTAWTNNQSVPILLFHGTSDAVVPLTEGAPFNLATLPSVHGSANLAQHLTRKNLPFEYYPQPNEPHEYWGTSNGTFLPGGPGLFWQDIINKSTGFMLRTMGLPATCDGVLTQQNFICNAIIKKNNSVAVSWFPGETENLSSFNVEYSSNGINWNPVANIKKLTQSSVYTFLHQSNERFDKRYYRIKKFLLSGNFLYSNVVLVENKYASPDILLFPNPTSAQVFIKKAITTISKEKVTVYNAVGKVVKQLVLSPLQKADLSSLSAGTYFLRFEQEKKTSRLIIKK